RKGSYFCLDIHDFHTDEWKRTMTSISPGVLTLTASIQEHLDHAVDDILTSLPSIEELSAAERRGIIARYTAVLEGNFIYWMTGAYLSVKSEEARSIILDNL